MPDRIRKIQVRLPIAANDWLFVNRATVQAKDQDHHGADGCRQVGIDVLHADLCKHGREPRKKCGE